MFTVVFNRKQHGDTIQETVVKTVEITVEITVAKTEVIVLKCIKLNSKVTAKKLVEITGLTRRNVEQQLSKFKKKIKRISPDKGGHWEVLE